MSAGDFFLGERLGHHESSHSSPRESCFIPADAKADDFCGIVVRARWLPLILCVAGSTTGYYKLIVSAYVSGVSNEEEGFCSPQLEGCRICWGWSQGSGEREDIFFCSLN